MKFFHTADWHLGKLVQGVHMTEDQHYILDQFIEAIEKEKPDAVIIAGDLYDRAVPPTEAVHLLNDVVDKIVLQLKTPVLAIAGNHDSPSRIHFGSQIMKDKGFHVVGQLDKQMEPVILHDEHGPVHFHLVPYVDPSVVRNLFGDEDIRSHDDAMKKIVNHIKSQWDNQSRHVFVGHAFVTPYGEEEENTSDSERPLSIGGAEFVRADHFKSFHYTALGHLHRAHYVTEENIQYSGSILKYSISEEHHRKGFNIVHLDQHGGVDVERRSLIPRRDMRTIEASMDEILTHPVNDDYVFVRLTDKTPILSPMEKVRSVYPRALHVERKHVFMLNEHTTHKGHSIERTKMSDLDLFKAFYKEVKGVPLTDDTEAVFKDVLDDLLIGEREEKIKEKTEQMS